MTSHVIDYEEFYPKKNVAYPPVMDLPYQYEVSMTVEEVEGIWQLVRWCRQNIDEYDPASLATNRTVSSKSWFVCWGEFTSYPVYVRFSRNEDYVMFKLAWHP